MYVTSTRSTSEMTRRANASNTLTSDILWQGATLLAVLAGVARTTLGSRSQRNGAQERQPVAGKDVGAPNTRPRPQHSRRGLPRPRQPSALPLSKLSRLACKSDARACLLRFGAGDSSSLSPPMSVAGHIPTPQAADD